MFFQPVSTALVMLGEDNVRALQTIRLQLALRIGFAKRANSRVPLLRLEQYGRRC